MRVVVRRVPYYDLSRSGNGSPAAVNRGYVVLVNEGGVDRIIFESMEQSVRMKLERDGVVYHGLLSSRVNPTNPARFIQAVVNRNALVDAIVGLPHEKKTSSRNDSFPRSASIFILIFTLLALVFWLVFAKPQ